MAEIISQELYQKIYEDEDLKYGRADHDRCPSTRWYPQFRHHLLGPVVDLGSGTGDFVKQLRKDGFYAEGMDWIDLDNGMQVKDITQEMDLSAYNSATCIDVLEHIPKDQIDQILKNMQKTRTQVIAVSKDVSKEPGYDIDLHITKMNKDQWCEYLSEYFIVQETIIITGNRYIFLTRS